MKSILVIIALLASTTGQAEPLWNNVEAGMTFEQVAALYPEKVPDPNKPGKMKRTAWHFGHTLIEIRDPIQISSDCWMKPTIHFSNGTVEDVTLDAQSYCSTLKAMLVSRYGEPVSDSSNTHTQGGVVTLGKGFRVKQITPDTVVTDDTTVWLKEGATVTLTGHGGYSAKVTYAPESPSSVL